MAITKFDTLKVGDVSFGNIEDRKYGSKRIALKLQNGPLLIQTPIMSNKIRFFPKKTENDASNSVIMYMTISFDDEKVFMQAISDVNGKVQEFVKDNSRTLFDSKKRTGSIETLFYDPITQMGDFNPSFRTSIAINGSDVPIMTEFFDDKGKKTDYEAFMKDMTVDGNFEGRAIIEFTHVYILADKRYGYKSNVRVIQRIDKPEADKIGSDNVVTGSVSELGCAFI